MTKSNRILAAIAACLVALAGLAGVAEAAKKPVQQATFKATLSGSQVTTWEYHDPKTDDPCDGSADGYGDQTLKFKTGTPFKITFYKPPKGQPDLFGTDGRPGVVPEPSPIRVGFNAERNGDFIPHNDVSNCDGPNGGGVIPQPDRPKDCGARGGLGGSVLLYFQESTSRSEEDDLFVPLEHYPAKDHLKLKTLTDPIYVDPRDGSGTDLDGTYENCPFLLDDASVPEEGDIYTSAHKIPERRLFAKGRKRLVLSGDTSASHGGGYSSGKTILAWNLRLTRIK